MMDTDMFLRAPVDPLALGVRRRDVVRVGARLRVRLGVRPKPRPRPRPKQARRGNVVSAEYSYLYGTQSGFAKRFLERRLLGRLAQVLLSPHR